MKSSTRGSIIKGVKVSTPLVFSAIFFGLIFGFTGASGELRLIFVSSMSFIIFAGSAQFITLILIVEHEVVLAIILVAILINLRHLLYGLILNPLLSFRGLKRALIAYFITDETFLVTTLVEKEQTITDTDYQLDYVLLGAGIFLWSTWNLATIAGFLLFHLVSDLVVFPDNFVISASFIGFLVDQFRNFPQDRPVIILTSIIALVGGHFIDTSGLLVIIMVIGAVFAMLMKYLQMDGDVNHE